jgi:phage gp16-like protein
MMAEQPTANNRQALYAKLAIGKKDLGFDDEYYYGIWLPMHGATIKDGKYSASTMSIGQLMAAVQDMVDKGFIVKHKSANAPGKGSHRKLADDAQSKKIRALWLELHAAGKVRDPSERSLAHFVAGQVKSSHGVEALQWLDGHQASRIIEQLKKWLARPVKAA